MSGIQNLLLGGSPAAAAAEDPNFEYVTLLLPGNGTNGAQNNTFLDSSTNNFTITRNGNTTQGTFSPFSRSDGYWSNYFDGSSSYLSFSSNSALAFGTSNITIEFWVNYADSNGNYLFYDARGTNISQTGIAIYVAGGTLYVNSGLTNIIGDGVAPSANTWHHIAYTRSGSSNKIFVDGVQTGSTGTDSTNFSTAYSTSIGSTLDSTYTASYSLKGYISNLRVLKGTAQYTANFTPPTVPLTAITNTQLLTCQSNRFIDNSTNAIALTATGSPSVQVFNPFEPSAAWSASTNGGSGYFDENGDYLDCGNGGTDYEFGSGDFTIEGWFYCLGKSLRHQMIMAKGSPTTNNAYDWRLYWGDTSNQRIWFDSNVFSVSSDTTAAEQLVLNAWNHIAVVRSGANGYLYLNGTRIDSVAASGTMNNSYTNVYVGAGNVGSAGQTYYNGYANGIRLLKGTAQYTGSTYTVPTSPFTAITNTELLLNFTNAGIYDAAAMNDLETAGNAQISTAQSKFGGSSISFDGTGDSLDIGQTTPFLSVWTGNFTIECWAYTNNLSAQHIVWANKGTDSSGYNAAYINTNGSIGMGKAGVNEILSASSTWTSGQWNHLAFVRNGSNLTIYYNGTSVATTASASTYLTTTATGFSIGKSFQTSPAYFNGYINDFRVTYGVARYTANFTAPTAAFPLF